MVAEGRAYARACARRPANGRDPGRTARAALPHRFPTDPRPLAHDFEDPGT